MNCQRPLCAQGFLPDLFAPHDRPCPGYVVEAQVNPFDLPPLDFRLEFGGYVVGFEELEARRREIDRQEAAGERYPAPGGPLGPSPWP